MTYTETVSETETTRVLLQLDEAPDAPYFYAASPLLRVDRRGYFRTDVEQVTEVGDYVVPARILEALERWSYVDDREKFDRYVKAFHGAIQVEWWTPYDGDSSYVTFDSRDYREKTESGAGATDMTEWRAYVEGDVWGIVTQKAVTWTSEHGETRVDWEDEDSVWGFYGHAYARETATSGNF